MTRRPPARPAPPPTEERLRLFIAIPAPPPVIAAAEQVLAALRGAGDVRWVASENLHLTLKFLGPTLPQQLEELRPALMEVANASSRFAIQLTGAGAFPNIRRPQTLWLGVEEESGRLADLATRLEQAVAAVGFPQEERPFRPHLTIGRVRSARGLSELSRRLEAAAAAPAGVAWEVGEFQLVRSVLRPSGPEYTVLQRFPLPEAPQA